MFKGGLNEENNRFLFSLIESSENEMNLNHFLQENCNFQRKNNV